MSILPNKPIRRNITDLKNNYPHDFGRFINALNNLTKSDDWPRICGIHGNTFDPNDTDILCPTDPKVVEQIGNTPNEPFYCAHSETRFIAWHTPYIYQFELLLNKYNTSKDKSYITLPYLFITTEPTDLSFMNTKQIEIMLDGVMTTIENPLAPENNYYFDKKGCKKIVTRNGFLVPTTKSEITLVKSTNNELYNVLYALRYDTFSSNTLFNKVLKKLIDFNPIEIPHNNIHDIIGGFGGNMSEISISAYDPIFWLHHCNIDRFFYNWLAKITNNFIHTITFPFISDNTLNNTLSPFQNTNPYTDNPNAYKFGWSNESLNFLKIRNMIQLEKYPYTYEHIEMKPYHFSKASIEIFGMPIPCETTQISVFLHPKNTIITDSNKNEFLAGSACWFGMNRYQGNCKRCNVSRTNFKISIQQFLDDNNISIDDINNYKWFIEGYGKLEQQSDNTYKTYTQEELIRDGNIELFTYSANISKRKSNIIIQFLKGVANILQIRKKKN